MLTTSFFAKKIPGYIALLLFATIMSGILMFFSTADLSSNVTDSTGLVFTLLTESAGSPGFLITVVGLSLIPFIVKLPKKSIFRLGIQFAILLVLSFVAKTTLKHVTEVPRPYTYQLQSLGIVHSASDFYQLSDTEKEAAVDSARTTVSEWRLSHWQGETNYSLPSGHTIFAAVCVVFWGGFFLGRRQFVPAAILIIWATGVGVSRIWLGMHWPTDLLASMACAGLLYCFVPEWDITTAHDRKH
ncbi:phosphatase PAP2 family protein [Photobacterium sp. SDRW27]|uniref:phosphatase PAP2 family protein n=1 Tax=Photobacterium obscurum TaxID=2829490 RepID=UPI0022430B3A|nr:phosphatase PAP2 family protein [Photobacterium obscurum]MCW8327937.1 phosphatase PAP2 family protein [Photobacterium obscurum]